MTLSCLSIIRSTAAIIVNVTVFPTNLVSYPYVRFMLCNLAHSLSAEKVNHEPLCTAARWTFARTLVQFNDLVARSPARSTTTTAPSQTSILSCQIWPWCPSRAPRRTAGKLDLQEQYAFERCRRAQQRAAVRCARQGDLQI